MGTNNEINLCAFSFYQPLPEGYFRLWSPDECEDCGCECEAPNSVQIRGSRLLGQLKYLGLKERTDRVEELGYSDEFGGAVCPDCYTKHEKAADADIEGFRFESF